MSGGFFRGTSADQDTRFSNKQAKLLKSQTFAPGLENLVDISKVKMDVMRPWIAHRVTELLGFEDEVLINFIYGLLEGKGVNGKEIQISITGFMEKNTGRFMKELWSLLLSAQNNTSGVPQQFLDAKEEETKKKMVETERIANEIQKRKDKESREQELEMKKKMNDEDNISRAKDVVLDRGSKRQTGEDDKEINGKNESRRRNRICRSPPSAEHSLSPPRRKPSRSISKSFSNSRSRSSERQRSRSISRSPRTRRRRSISSENALTSPFHPSISPRRRTCHYKRRSPSPICHRMRSPIHRRSRSPVYRRSRSPIQRRSRPPSRYRSRTPVRRRSRSPLRPRSPLPIRRRSPSPVRRRYRRSPSTQCRRSVSPVRRRPIVGERRLSPPPPPPIRGSHSPQEMSSQSPPSRRTPSSLGSRSPKRQRRSPMPSPSDRIRDLERLSPVRRAPVALRSPQRDIGERNEPRRKLPALSPSSNNSQSVSESPPPASRRRSPSEVQRSVSPYESPVKQIKERMIHDGSRSSPQKSRELKTRHDTPKASVEDDELNCFRDEYQKFKSSEKRSIRSSVTRVHRSSSQEKVNYENKSSSERLTSHRSDETQSDRDNIDSSKDQNANSKNISAKERYSDMPQPERPLNYKGASSSEKGNIKGTVSKLGKKDEGDEQFCSLGSDSEEGDRHKSENNEKKKLRESKRHETASYDDYRDSDSQIDAMKAAKKRRKEEKRLKKEEKLEIALREKALESLRAKKGASN